MSLEAVLDYMELARQGDDTAEERKELLREAKRSLTVKIDGLQLAVQQAEEELRNYEKALLPQTERLMNNGVDMTTGRRFTKGYGYFTEMESYDQLLAAWDQTVREMTRYSVIVENAIDKASERDVPDILCSALTDDCIGRGKTIKEGGAVYDFISGLQVGIANMADSLAAIKKLVFEEKRITARQLWEAILDDFTSPESRRIQRLLQDVPKYGNDDDSVDQLVVEAYDSYLDEIKKYPNNRYHRGPIGGIRYGGTSSISANVGQGMYKAAVENLADGAKTTLILVSRPEETPLLEVERSSRELKELGILNQLLIINGVLMEATDVLSQNILAKQQKAMENRPAALKSLETYILPLRSYNILGLENIRAFFQQDDFSYGERDGKSVDLPGMASCRIR